MATEAVSEDSDSTTLRTTWDGLPVADDLPRGAAVVVRRPASGAGSGGGSGQEYLVLHRAWRGADYEGDWAWTPPSGARQPGEPLFPSALRELEEEAGLTGVAVSAVDLSGGWSLYLAEVGAAAVALLDPEHDRYAWLGAEEALALCAPETVRDNIRRADALPPAVLAFAPAADGPHTLLLDGAEAGSFGCGPAVAGGAETELHWTLDASAAAVPGLLTRGLWAYLRDILTVHHPTLRRVTVRPADPAEARAAEAAGFTPSGADAHHSLDVARVFGL